MVHCGEKLKKSHCDCLWTRRRGAQRKLKLYAKTLYIHISVNAFYRWDGNLSAG